MELTEIERSVLNRLFKASKGLYMRTLQSQYNLTAELFFGLISSLKSIDYIKTVEDRIHITSQGMEYMVANPIKLEKRVSSDDAIPENFKGKKIGINEFYIPIKFEK